jgi:hypothetical protein
MRYITRGQAPCDARVQRRLSVGFWLRQYCTVLICSLCAIQVAIGGDLFLITCAVISIGVGLVPVFLFGMKSTIGIFFSLLTFFFPGSALLIKSCLLQPIQSNLFAPELSFMVMTEGMVAATGAAIVLFICSNKILNIGPVFKELSPAALELLCYTTAIVGILGIIGRESSGGIGRLAALTAGMIFLSPIAATQLALKRSDGRRSFSPLSLALLIFCFILSLTTGTKQGAFATVFCYFFPVYLYRGKFKMSNIFLLSLGIIVLILFVSPAINIARSIREYASPLELMERTLAAMVDLYVDNFTAVATDLVTYNRGDNAYYIGYISETTSAIDRFVFVSYIDALLRFSSERFVGYSVLFNFLIENIVPNITDPGQKDLMSNGDFMLQYFGVYADDIATMITLPVFGEGYLIDGHFGVFVVTFLSFLLIGGAMVFVFGNVSGNPFAMWFIALNSFVIAGAGSTGLAFFVIRIVPVYMILNFLIGKLVRKNTLAFQKFY